MHIKAYDTFHIVQIGLCGVCHTYEDGLLTSTSQNFAASQLLTKH